MNWVIGLIESIRSLRAEMGVPAGAKLPLLLLGFDETARGIFDRNRPMIMRLARLDEVTEVSEAPKGAVAIPLKGGEACLPLADVIDVAAEEARLTKAIAKLEKELGGLNAKLGNEKFLAKAPEEVITENRDRVVEAGDELAKLQEGLARLKAL